MAEETKDEEGDTDGDFLNHLMGMLEEDPCVVVEMLRCECGGHSVAGHYFNETIPCQHCGKHHQSRSPRHPAKGEVTLEHVSLALETLEGCYANSAANVLPAQAKWAELDARTQLIITQVATGLVVSALKQVSKLAMALAEGNK